MSDDNMSSDLPTKVGDPPEIDEEIDEFAENAFDALMMDGPPKESSEESQAAEAVATETAEYEDVELDDVIMVSDVPPEDVSAASAPPSAPPQDGPSTGEIQVARLRSEISGLKAKIAESSGGVSSRQFLDLREALNTKDKEILDLRDQVTGRDKAILELKDESIALERARPRTLVVQSAGIHCEPERGQREREQTLRGCEGPLRA
ncbi:MAG: hypothetical protein JRD94_09640 [Deltaproteobacteria bacterium]|nr:hypothetical protein [Deltaproteobacteria bacterium]